MPRFYLIPLLLLHSFFGSTQNELGKYLEFADRQYQKGDYVYALDYYEKALQIDSNSVSILWKYAETLRAYKDYPKAAHYYHEIYIREDAQIYPYSLLYWALMEKQLGNYDTAIDLFKRAKKKYVKDKKAYLYLKSKRELESCLWAQSAIKDTATVNPLTIPDEINTPDSEFGHSITHNLFYFSSLRADSIGTSEEVYDPQYHHQLYTYAWKDSSEVIQLKLLQELSQKDLHTGNGVFSLDGKRFYFSTCQSADQQFNCSISVVQYYGDKWGDPAPLSDWINEPGTNTTTPAIALIDGEEWLIFSSNRAGGDGGMDLYFSVMKNNGNQFGKVKPLSTANSPDNEITPWFDIHNQRLYFSSSWWNGLGGYDVQYMTLENNRFTEPVNPGLPFNSAANDIYYFEAGDSMFVSSNRLGVKYAKNPTCCSDIFGFAKPIEVKPVTKKETLADLNKRLPVTLYFHNDTPDPRSRETTTNVNYTDSYTDYMAMIPEYKKEYSKGLNGEKASDAEEDIESFFTEYVEKGVKDLDLFETLLLEELHKGLRIRVSVRGFASPLAKTEYNVALTQRRIQSLINHLNVCNNGAFRPYLEGTAINGGKLEVVGIPFGEYTANQITSDNPNDIKNSVFSQAAAIERKIEIQSVSYIDSDSLFFQVDLNPTSLVLGKIKNTEKQRTTLSIFNNGPGTLTLSKIVVQDSLFEALALPVVSVDQNTTLILQSTRPLPAGLFSLPLDLYFEGHEKPLRILILGEGIQ